MRSLMPIAACLAATAVGACGAAGARTNCKEPPDRDLLLAVRAHAGPIVLPGQDGEPNAARLTISACQTSDSEATATLTVFGMADDSVRDLRHGLRLAKGGAWRVTADAHTQRCQRGRGSQEFSSAKCV